MSSTEFGKGARSRCGHRWPHLYLLVAMVGSLSVLSVKAFAADSRPTWAGNSPDEQGTFLEQRINKMLDWVNADPSQRSAIKNVVERMRAELQPIRQDKARLHTQIKQALTAQTLDPAAIENLRVQAAAIFDRGSKVITKAIVDSGNVLSAEQRQTLMKRLEEERQQRRQNHSQNHK